jgi:hypothetical protein
MVILLVVILIFAIFILSFLVVAIGDPPNCAHDLDFGGPHPFSLLVKSGGDPLDPPKPPFLCSSYSIE